MSLCPSSWCQTFVFNNYLTFLVVRWNAMTGPNKLANLDLGCDYHPPVRLCPAAAPHVFATMTSWHLGQRNHGSRWFWRRANLNKTLNSWRPRYSRYFHFTLWWPKQAIKRAIFVEELLTNARTNVIQCFFWQWTGSIYKRLCLPESMGWNDSIIKKWIWVCLQLGHFKPRGFDCRVISFLPWAKPGSFPYPYHSISLLKLLVHRASFIILITCWTMKKIDIHRVSPKIGVWQDFLQSLVNFRQANGAARHSPVEWCNKWRHKRAGSKVLRRLWGYLGLQFGFLIFPSRLEYFASYDKPLILIYHDVHI